MRTTALGVERWFERLELPGFAPAVSAGVPLYAEPAPEVAARTKEVLGTESVHDVLDLRDSTMYASFQRLDGRLTMAAIPPESAGRFYDGGTTIYLRNVARFAGFEHEITDVFDLPADSVKLELYCNRPGAVTRTHFDPFDVMTVQLEGRKTWRIAPNDFAPAPFQAWATLDQVPADVRGYANGAAPTEMPDGARSYDLEPGSVLYVPRGYWHETYSDRDSFSLHLQFTPPTRLDSALTTLLNELIRDRYWREPSFRPGLDVRDLESLRAAVDRLDERDLDRASVEDLPVGPADRFVRAGQAALGIEAIDGARTRIAVTAYGARRTQTTHLEISGEFVPACRWLNALVTGTEIGVADVLREAPDLTKSDAQELLRTLEQVRLVRRAGSS